MKVTVFGASGKVGRLVVRQLLDEGHEVVAFTHSSTVEPNSPKLSIVQGDIHNGEDIARAVTGCDAVISTLGSWHTAEKNILSSAMERVIPAMRDMRIKRIVTLTGSGAFSDDDNPTAFDHLQHTLFNTVAPKILRDAEEHIRLLAESGLDWTVLRSPPMNESGSTKYKLGDHFPMPWQTIHRQAVAQAMISLLTTSDKNHEAPFITRS